MKTPVVLIHSGAGSSLESFYEGVRQSLNERYHQPGNSFPTFTLSDEEIAEQESLSSYAAHASDNLRVNGNSLYVNGVHIERLIS